MRIVMFPHPAKEYTLPRGVYRGPQSQLGWNLGCHRRRFMLSSGEYVNDRDCNSRSRLVFWGEWEADTLVTRFPGLSAANVATCLHEPMYPTPCPSNVQGECCANTDPCVFGDTFKYALCRQLKGNRNGIRTPTQMQKLEPGSLIVFGGPIDDVFYLDTVFVTGSRQLYKGPDAEHVIDCNSIYRTLTLDQTHGDLSFYRGVTWADRQEYGGIYSFVPCKVVENVKAEPQTLRERCKLNLPALNQIAGKKIFNVKNMQSFCSVEASSDKIKAMWTELMQQVKHQKFVPGVHFDWPSAPAER